MSEPVDDWYDLFNILFIVVMQYHDRKHVFHIGTTDVGIRFWLVSGETILQ